MSYVFLNSAGGACLPTAPILELEKRLNAGRASLLFVPPEAADMRASRRILVASFSGHQSLLHTRTISSSLLRIATLSRQQRFLDTIHIVQNSLGNAVAQIAR